MEQMQENRYTMEEYEQIIAEYKRMSDEELLDIVRKKTEKLGKTPTRAEIPASHYLKQKFGPWPRVLEAAGVREVSEAYIRRKAARAEKRRTRHQAYKRKKAAERETVNA